MKYQITIMAPGGGNVFSANAVMPRIV